MKTSFINVKVIKQREKSVLSGNKEDPGRTAASPS